MTLIDYATRWLDGEIAIGKCALAFGAVLAVAAVLLWRVGESPDEFLRSETERNAKSVRMYPYSPLVCAVIFISAMLIFALSASPAVRGWCIAAMFVAFALTLTDFFSRENGERYPQELRALQK